MFAEGTRAVPVDRQGLSHCPACGGRLVPYRLSVDLGGFRGAHVGKAWVAVCRGTDPARDMVDEALPACGFSVRLDVYDSAGRPVA